MMQIEENKELELAWNYVTKTSMNIFLTGNAGTGKTTFLKRVVAECPKPKIVLAPTGVAAINAGGVTLHSFFQLPFGLFLPEYQHLQAHDKEGRYKFHRKKLRLIRSLELMIIDEVSMLRCDIVDELDALLRKLRRSDLPFGGVQVLMIGDVQQLSPVVKDDEWQMLSRYYSSPYFFDAKVLKNNPYRMVELNRIFRQRDGEFIEILSAVREKRMTTELLARLNQRYIPDYETPEGCITLSTHNKVAKDINDTKLAALTSPEFTYTATIEGNFPENMYPQDVELTLKKGAQVMFTKNDPSPLKQFVNGTLGKVAYLDDDHITVMLSSGIEVEVEPQPWENLKYDINEETKEIVSKIDGLFTQYPLKTAWAITIHKSQGLTFDEAVIDAGHSFSHGQVYVALSRCRTLEGIVLKQKISPSSIIDDYRVDDFSDFVTESLPSPEDLKHDCRLYFMQVVKDLYDFDALTSAIHAYRRFARVSFPGLFPKALEAWDEVDKKYKDELSEIGLRFQRSLEKIIGEDYLSSDYLQERICKASEYFLAKAVKHLLPLVEVSWSIDFDDKSKKTINRQYFTNFAETLFRKLFLWNYTLRGFELESYIKERSLYLGTIPEYTPLQLSTIFSVAKAHPEEGLLSILERYKQQAQRNLTPQKNADYEDVKDEELFEQLRLWRKETAEENNVPPYCILHQKALIAIANTRPETKAELLAIKGVGKTFVRKYGPEILSVIHGGWIDDEQSLF